MELDVQLEKRACQYNSRKLAFVCVIVVFSHRERSWKQPGRFLCVKHLVLAEVPRPDGDGKRRSLV